jgi:hypothetical protein
VATRTSGRKPAKRVARNDRRFQSTPTSCNTDSGQFLRPASTALWGIVAVRNHSAPADTILHQVYMYTGPTSECMPREPASPAGIAGLVSPSPARRHPPGFWRIRATPATCRSVSPPQDRPATGYSECSKSSIHPSADPVDGFISGTPVPPVSAHLAWPCIHQNAAGLQTTGPSFSGGHAAVLSSQLPTHHSLSVH